MIECQVLEDNYRYKMKYSPDYQGVDTEAVRVCTASLGGSTIAVQWACVQAAGLQAQHTHEGGGRRVGPSRKCMPSQVPSEKLPLISNNSLGQPVGGNRCTAPTTRAWTQRRYVCTAYLGGSTIATA